MQIRQVIIFLILLLVISPEKVLYAQPGTYTYLHLDREDGLASNHVLSILQDKKGFLWFGTSNGLQRYDGRQFVHYRHRPGDAGSLASDMVISMLEDATGTLWILSTNGISTLQASAETFQQILTAGRENFAMHEQFNLVEDTEGQLWLVSHMLKKAYVYGPATKSFVEAEYTRFDNIQPHYSLYQDQLASFKSPNPYCFLKDHRGIVWAAGDRLLALYPGRDTFTEIEKHKTLRYGIDYNLIFSIAEDREGTVWLGTDQGLYYFNPDKHLFFFPPNLKNSEQMVVTGFLETNDGEIWVSTLSSGIRVYNQQFQHLRTYLPEDNKSNQANSIFGMVQDRDGIVWAGTQDGLLCIETTKSTVRTIPLASESLIKAFIDSIGTIWWGTASGKVLRWDTGKNQFHRLPLPEESKEWGDIQGLLDGGQNTLWIATEQAGVYQVDKTTGCISKSFTKRNSPEALLSNQTGTMIWYNDTTLLVSTQEGLHFIDTKQNKVRALTTANGLPANAILNVIKDRNGSLLLTTQYSLCHWDAHTGKLLQYGSREGLLNQSYPFSTAYRLQDKRVVIGMMQNFFYFHPDSLHYTKPLPEVQITGVKVFNEALQIDSALGQKGVLQLSHRQNFFTVEFASMMYYDEPRIRYYYQLEGVDKSWVEAGNKRFASYTDLAGGKYLFKVKAQADNGPATIEATTLSVWVSQPFWRTYWFIFLLALAILGAFYGLYRLRINRLLGLEQVRSRIARDLHDDMGSTLSTISILSSIAQQQVKSNGVKTEEYLEKISTYSQRMMEAMDDIVWSVNPVNDSVENLIARMREFGTEMLEPKKVGFSLQSDHLHPSLHLPTQIRYDCFMVFKEAINNAAKYAQCHQVRVTLSSRGKGLQVTIQDDGLGFDQTHIQQGNGLVNMQKRIEQLKGSLQIESAQGKGTCISFFIPNL